MQQGMLLGSLRSPGTGTEVEQLVFRLRERVDADALARAWQDATDAHDILRTAFRWAGVDVPEQWVAPDAAVPFQVHGGGAGEPATSDAALEAWLRADRARELALDHAPLQRVALFRRGDCDWTLVWTFHHALLDGRAMVLLLREIFLRYAAHRDGAAPVLPALRPFRHYAEWLAAQDFSAAEAYWRGVLDGFGAATPLPHAGAAPAAAPGDPYPQHTAELDDDASARLHVLAERHGLTMNVLVQAAWGVLLARHAGETDVVFGTTRGGRASAAGGADDVTGPVFNHVPVRLRVERATTLLQCAAQLREQSLGARPHEHTPPARVAAARPAADGPLYETLAVFERRTMTGTLQALGGEWATREVEILRRPGVPLVLNAYGAPRVRLTLTVAPTRYDAAAAERLLAHLGALLRAMADDPHRPAWEVALAGHDEAAFIARAEAGEPLGDAPLLPDAFAAWAARTPGAPAVVAGDETLTYAELDARSARLANRLAALGVGPETRVAIALPRTADLVVAVLAVLRAGGAYLPLDAQLPSERVGEMLADAGARVLVTHGAFALPPLPAGCRVLRLDDEAEAIAALPPRAPRVAIDGEMLAHVLYTSGSTGRPKGVMVRHANVATFVAALQRVLPLRPGERVLGSTAISFDVSVAELHRALWCGATLVLVENALALAEAGPEPLAHAGMVPGAAEAVLRAGGFPGGVRRLCLAGDTLPPVLARELAECGIAEVHALYGPTEDTTYSTHVRFMAGDPVTIGRPLPGRRAYVLDAGLRPVPLGAAGEVYLAGSGLARGYLGRPALTAERFLPDPFSPVPGERMYRSGDRARWTAGGVMDFLGRTDHQVKVRGYRVEPGEVEAALRAHPTVRRALVVARRGVLVAYVTPRPGETADPAALLGHLRGRLPGWMVPAAVVPLDAFPLTATGKVERRALPEPPLADRDATYVAPRTGTEAAVAALWAELLGVERVGAHDGFFALGGQSLLALRAVAGVRQALGVSLPVAALFDAPTVADFAARVDAARAAGAGEGTADAIPRADRGRPIPASFGQERLWVLDQLAPGSPVYNVPLAWRIAGALNAAALGRATGELVRRHESLRTALRAGADGLVQVIHPPVPVALPVEDADPSAIGQLLADEAQAPFDLGAGPLFRARLLRVEADDHLLLLTLHHAVCDGWSLGVLARELGALYAAFARGGASPLAEPALQYADFAAWQRARTQGPGPEAEVAWWRARLAGAPAVLELPTDRPRPPLLTFRGAHEDVLLPAPLVEGVEALARAAGATSFMVLLAAFQAVLSRWSGQDDVVVGTPLAGRAGREAEGVVGFFVNTLPLRTDLSGDPTFAQLLARVREGTLAVFEHQALPFERVADEVAPGRMLAHTPVFQAILALHDGLEGELSLPGLRVRAVETDTRTAKTDLALTFRRTPQGLSGIARFSADLFEGETVRRLLGHLARVLEQAVARPDTPVTALELLGEAERRTVLETWNRSETAYPRDATVHALFEAHAAAAPERPAVILGERVMTYGELNARANRLARHLRALGVRTGERVAVCVERSPELIVSLLAIAKAGGAFVPLDPGYPADRKAYMLADSGAAVLLAHAHLAAELPEGTARTVIVGGQDEAAAGYGDGDLDVAVSPLDLAYVMYTSGSTGRPKGIAVPHRSAVRLVCGIDYAVFDAGETLLQLCSVSFDPCMVEIWGALLNGARLVLFPGGATSIDELGEVIARHGVTSVWLTTGLFHLMVDDRLADLRGVRQLMAGGDVLSVPHCARVVRELPGTRLVNGYGPTENGCFTSCQVVTGADLGRATIPIGRPMTNTTVYVLDARMRPCPAGVLGELYTGGDGLARGYLGRPAMTAERFVPDPFGAAGGRLYRTGDRARWLAGGTLEFLGRVDRQVKVRGFRIEPGEVETALLGQPGIGNAVVVVREPAPGDRRLVAYVTADAGAPSPAELRDRLRRALPEYMVPAAVVVLDALPLNPNGKVDRAALPEPDFSRDDAWQPPRTDEEVAVAGVWAEVLRLERVGAHDHFFALGGHSLLAAQAVSRIREAFGVQLPLRALWEAPTVAGFAAEVAALRAAGGAGDDDPVTPVARNGALALSPAQERIWLAEEMERGTAAWVIPMAWRITGAVDAAALERAIGALVARHEALRTVIRAEGGRAWQVIHPPVPFHLPVDDVASVDPEAEVLRRTRGEAAAPFDLEDGPLFRARLVRLAAGDHLLLLTFHHAVADGWSMGVLCRELSALYAAALAGGEAALPALPVQYADFAAWQRRRMDGGRLERDLAWWTERLRGAPARLELPADRARPAVRSFAGARVAARLPAATRDAVEALARRDGATPFMVMLAAFQLLLSRYAGVDDVVVGAPIAGRTRREAEGLIGCFVNTLALRGDLSGDPTFAELLARVRETTLGAFEHQELPFERLVEALAPIRSAAHAPVCQVLFALQNTEAAPLALAGAEARALAPELAASKLDLSLHAWLDDAGVELRAVYATELFDTETIQRLLDRFGALLAAAAGDPSRPLSALPVMTEGEREMVARWNATDTPFPADRCIHHLFKAQARRTPGAVALETADEHVTYAELDERAGRIARALRGRGVGVEARVGVCLEPSAHAIAALLGVLKAGAAYVPIHPGFPRERVAWMLADAALSALVTDVATAARLELAGPLLLRVDRDLPPASVDDGWTAPEVGAGNAAYLIYTSGSTGTPKGVVVEHRAVVNLVTAQARTFGAGPGERILQFAPLTFDASAAEIFIALCSGATLCLAGRDALIPGPGLAELLRDRAITCAKLTPSALAALPPAELPALRTLIVGGEACPAELVRRWAPGRRMFNVYGPTEATVRATTGPLPPGVETVDVGRPLPNARVHVLDAALRPAAPGIPGELYVGGVPVARGYWRRAALTADRFVPDPFSPTPGARMYRTGDRARWRPDGTVEFLGRLDAQVKVRGARVEPGEVEAALRALPGVREGAVVARQDVPGDTRLVAYAVAAPGHALSAAALRDALRGSLPDFMVPSAVVLLENLPLNASGKVDRRALPAPDYAANAGAGAPPRTPLETGVAEIWGEVLHVERVGRDDDFFALGGHSLLVVQVLARVRERMGVRVLPRAMFEHPTVSGLALAIAAAREVAGDRPAPALAFEEGEL